MASEWLAKRATREPLNKTSPCQTVRQAAGLAATKRARAICCEGVLFSMPLLYTIPFAFSYRANTSFYLGNTPYASFARHYGKHKPNLTLRSIGNPRPRRITGTTWTA